jgi:hypothetical protein
MLKRTAEFVLGLIGGIFGVLAGLFLVFVGGVASAMEVKEGNIVSGVAWISILLSILGIIGSCMVKKKTVLASIFMLIAGIAGFFCTGLFFIVPGALLLIAGIMGLARKGGGQSEA